MRVLFVTFIIILFILCTPLIIIIALAIVCMSGFPILFRQRRIGKNGISFTMYKFRTMHVGAEKEQATLKVRNESDGPVFKLYDDPRFTEIGKFLAHTGLDELPQLYNVLRGDMALFGPRPLPNSEFAKLINWQKKRYAIKPGIISPAILSGGYHENFDEWMKSDISYTKNKNILYDLRLVFRSIKLLTRLIFGEVFS